MSDLKKEMIKISSFVDQLRINKDRVEMILSKYPETRDSDKLLWLAYMCIFHELKCHIGTNAYNKLKRLITDPSTPSFESVRRVRQKIQEKDTSLAGSNRQYRLNESENTRQDIHTV